MSNEAAERLRTDARDTIRMVRPEGWAVDWWMATVDRALADERKATVEQMMGDASDLIAQGVHAIDAYHRAARAIFGAEAKR